MTLDQEKCTQSYALSAETKQQYHFAPEAIDQSIAVIASANRKIIVSKLKFRLK